MLLGVTGGLLGECSGHGVHVAPIVGHRKFLPETATALSAERKCRQVGQSARACRLGAICLSFLRSQRESVGLNHMFLETTLAIRERLVMTQIFFRHPPCGKPFFEMRSYPLSIEFTEACDGLVGFLFARHNKPRYSVVNDFRYGTGLERNNGRAAGHGLDH